MKLSKLNKQYLLDKATQSLFMSDEEFGKYVREKDSLDIAILLLSYICYTDSMIHILTKERIIHINKRIEFLQFAYLKYINNKEIGDIEK